MMKVLDRAGIRTRVLRASAELTGRGCGYTLEVAERNYAAAIRRLQQAGGLEALPEKLRQSAQLRLENPEFSLRELGESLTPSITRSGVNHRMKRLLQIADEIFP